MAKNLDNKKPSPSEIDIFVSHIQRGELEQVRKMLAEKGPALAAAQQGFNPVFLIAIQHAINTNKYDIVEELLPKVNVNMKDQQGDTALMRAAHNNNTRLIHLLIKYNAKIDFINSKGYTALMFAVLEGHYNSASLLLRHGANPDIKDNEGDTPRSEALNSGGQIKNLFNVTIEQEEKEKQERERQEKEKQEKEKQEKEKKEEERRVAKKTKRQKAKEDHKKQIKENKTTPKLETNTPKLETNTPKPKGKVLTPKAKKLNDLHKALFGK